jgi:hypothetical protein
MNKSFKILSRIFYYFYIKKKQKFIIIYKLLTTECDNKEKLIFFITY